MIAIKKVLYMSVPLLMVVASAAQADDDTASDSLTVGLGGQYAPRYSGSDKQVWQVVPVLQWQQEKLIWHLVQIQADLSVSQVHSVV